MSTTPLPERGQIQCRYGYSLCILSLLLMAGVFGLVFNSSQTTAWPSTTGVVIAHGLGSNGIRTVLFHYWVAYKYEIDGKSFKNDCVYFCPTDAWPLFPFGVGGRVFLEKRFPVGQKIEVFYDPADPRKSVLVRGVSWSVYLMPIWLAIVGLLVSGVFCICRGRDRPSL